MRYRLISFLFRMTDFPQTGTVLPSSYDAALRQCGREAAATLAAAIAVTLFFWGTLILFMDSTVRFFGLPLWFYVAVLGGYLFSIVAVIFIVKRVFREIPLDLKPKALEGRGE